MTRSHRQAGARPGWQRHSAALLGTVLFLVLAVSGAAHSDWTTAASTATGSVTSGKVSITQSNYDQLKFEYKTGTSTTTKPITLTNGSVPSTYTLTFGAVSSPAALAGAVSVTTWPVAAAANCTASTTLPGNQTVFTWASATPLTGSLAASGSVVLCVRTSMSSASMSTYAGGQVAARLDLIAVVGTNWKAQAASVTVTQTVPDVSAPTAPTNLTATATTDAAATLTWTAASDNVGVAAYRLYRDGVRVGADITGRTYTDTGLNVGTTYVYTVGAADAAGNLSAQSTPASVTTSPTPSPTSWYRVKSGTLCVTGSTRTNGAVTVEACDETKATQLWKYEDSSNGAFISSRDMPGLVWQRPTSGLDTVVVAARDPQEAGQQWSGDLVGNGVYRFTIGPNKNKPDCAYAPANTAGTALKVQPCIAAASQQFTLTAANG
ncbi:RICIN domain-containing protein [Cryobacterium aureum]|uniref:RICIN domain-containing protein n=1 Tax=Cryobacterium aureum TaxID=995037 RepID=UPI000CF4880A|nr:RICIN domain-containing protein [Cryobacterium aureum]